MKCFKTITIFVAILMVPALVFSADRFAPAKAVIGSDNTVIVPLEISNRDGLMAIDIPLKFSEGVTLKEVTFEGTRTEYFDLKIANINNVDNVVIIGIIVQTTPTMKPPLAAGEGPVANLVFEVDNLSLNEITIEAIEMDAPRHALMYVYNTRSDPKRAAFDKSEPEFDRVSVALSGMVGEGLPTSFSLEQNYPNPFNPVTEIAFGIPVNSHVRLDIFNVLGQKVTTLVDGELPAGAHEVTWDGRNSDGGSVSSGVYFYRITADSFTDTRKMMLLK